MFTKSKTDNMNNNKINIDVIDLSEEEDNVMANSDSINIE